MPIVLKVTAFILWVNFLPPAARIVLGERFKRPLDGGGTWFDRKPLFGPHKTIRGIVASILGGTVMFPLLAVPWWVACAAAVLAMAGDLLSSFIKRRFDFPSGRNIPGLDQAFESLFPVLFLQQYLGLYGWQSAAVLAFFIPVALLGAYFWSIIAYNVPPANYPRIVSSIVRLREWRSCHPGMARIHVLFNLSSFLSYDIFYTWVFKLAGLEKQGVENTLSVETVEKTFWFDSLPERFDSFRILFLVDLHLDGLEGLTERIMELVCDLEVDLCLVAGDFRMKTYGPMEPSLLQLRKLLGCIRSRNGILGVLGNHDCIEMTFDLEEAGLDLLFNDSWKIEEGGENIWIIGVDDPHYYRVDDVRQAFRDVPRNGFTIFLAHSPEAYRSAAAYHPELYLCGHTHGGQICLPGRGPILTNSRAPRFTAVGRWEYDGMQGYTSRGAGASGVPLRFNCPGEITLITLRRKEGADAEETKENISAGSVGTSG